MAKKFAYYIKDPTAGSGLDDDDRKPVMLSSGILENALNYTKPLSLPQSPLSAGTCISIELLFKVKLLLKKYINDMFLITATPPLDTNETCFWNSNECEIQVIKICINFY